MFDLLDTEGLGVGFGVFTLRSLVGFGVFERIQNSVSVKQTEYIQYVAVAKTGTFWGDGFGVLADVGLGVFAADGLGVYVRILGKARSEIVEQSHNE